MNWQSAEDVLFEPHSPEQDFVPCRTQPGWGAVCKRCGKWATRWDFSARDALDTAAREHRCSSR